MNFAHENDTTHLFCNGLSKQKILNRSKIAIPITVQSFRVVSFLCVNLYHVLYMCLFPPSEIYNFHNFRIEEDKELKFCRPKEKHYFYHLKQKMPHSNQNGVS